MTHQPAENLSAAVDVDSSASTSGHEALVASGEEQGHASIWVGIDPKCEETRVLTTTGPSETILKARLSGTDAAHPRAVPHLLEALAMSQGMPVRAALVVEGPDDSSATRLCLDALTHFGGGPLYTLEFVHGRKRRHRDPLDRLGRFHDQRQLLLFEVLPTTGQRAHAQRPEASRRRPPSTSIPRGRPRGVQPVAADAPAGALGDARPARATRASDAAFFTGEEGQKRRTQNIVDFHDDPACRVLFATDAGGVGLNLQRAASACINIELPWNPGGARAAHRPDLPSRPAPPD